MVCSETDDGIICNAGGFQFFNHGLKGIFQFHLIAEVIGGSIFIFAAKNAAYILQIFLGILAFFVINTVAAQRHIIIGPPVRDVFQTIAKSQILAVTQIGMSQISGIIIVIAAVICTAVVAQPLQLISHGKIKIFALGLQHGLLGVERNKSH